MIESTGVRGMHGVEFRDPAIAGNPQESVPARSGIEQAGQFRSTATPT